MSQRDTSEPDLIEAYLDDLAARLHGPRPRSRRILQEAEAHLRDAAEAAAAAAPGTDPVRSSAIHQQVIADFGRPGQVARAHNRALLSPAALGPPAALTIGRIVAIGLLVMGVSAAMLRILTNVVGRTTMFADPPGTHYSAASCAYWLKIHPGAGSCARALLLESADDAVVQRAAAGVLGLILLAAVMLVRRRRPDWTRSIIPTSTVPVLCLLAFAGAAAVLIGIGLDRIVVSDARGAGMFLTDGLVSALAAVTCAAVLLRDLLGGGREGAFAGP